jgi:DNA-binding transcriptional ArsR family regulator/uncharacterized protein YndB with AHSA1/START domain
VDAVFKALADPTRRELLDELFRSDGQSLSSLERRFSMSRFGVMKHLKVLEDAGLVVTRRNGREKLHFLNPVPIRFVHDRWVDKYAASVTSDLVELKQRLESDMTSNNLGSKIPPSDPNVQTDRTMQKVFEIYIKTTPEQLWHAITDRDMRGKFQFGMVVDSDWQVGSDLEMSSPKAPSLLGRGSILEVDPPRRLVQTMIALWSEDVESEGESRITWEIEPIGDSCRLTVIHDQMREGAHPEIYGGWPMILSGLKTWLETGAVLTTPGSLLYT